MSKDANRDAFLFVLGAIAGTAVALLLAPQSGARTRRQIRRGTEDAADYIADVGQDLVDNCEDLYRRTTELAGEGGRELSRRYKDLAQRSRQLVNETAELIRR